jgi:hypothetical protein
MADTRYEVPRDAGARGSARNVVIRTSGHTTMYDSDKSATAACDENANRMIALSNLRSQSHKS